MPTDAQIAEEIIDSVAISNLKTVAEVASHSMGLAMQNAVAHQNRLNIVAEAAIGNITKNLTEADPIEAVSILKTLSGNDLAQQLAQLLSALASNQQGAKTAQTTPPPTA